MGVMAFLECMLNSYSTQVELSHGMWNLPRPGIKPMSAALAGRFLTTGPPGKSGYGISVDSLDSFPSFPDHGWVLGGEDC